jgi:hypothetical protein
MIETDSDLIIYNHNFYKQSIEKALNITEQYVIKHKLILTGGTAIDLALRTKGLHIYDDDELPDYDIVSDQNLYHAQQLAEILCNEGLEDINVINAFHISTVRVRFKRFPVLDATYVPTNIFERMPYMDIPIISDILPIKEYSLSSLKINSIKRMNVTSKSNNSFRVIHPNYQKIDQRLSLGDLLNLTGVSLNIFNRLEKDVKRNKLLMENFEFPDDQVKFDVTQFSIPLDLISADLSEINYIGDTDITQSKSPSNLIGNEIFIAQNNLCTQGYLSYALIYNEYKKIVSKDLLKDIIDPNVSIKNNKLTIDVPIGANILFFNCNNKMDDLMNSFKNIYGKRDIKKYNRLLDLQNITYKLDYDLFKIELCDSYESRFTVNSVHVNGFDIIITNYNRVLAYFMYNFYLNQDDTFDNNIFCMYYHSLLKMIHNIHVLYEEKNIINNHSIFYPSINIYGIKNYPHTYFAILEKLFTPEKVIRPSSSYPRYPKCKATKPFDFSSSEFYLLDVL